jgi:hypothetical protein
VVAAELIELLPTKASVSTTMEVFEAVALDPHTSAPPRAHKSVR